jgi:hypothetical protein
VGAIDHVEIWKLSGIEDGSPLFGKQLGLLAFHQVSSHTQNRNVSRAAVWVAALPDSETLVEIRF